MSFRARRGIRGGKRGGNWWGMNGMEGWDAGGEVGGGGGGLVVALKVTTSKARKRRAVGE